MGAVLQFSKALETLECGECGITFAVPGHWLASRRDNHENEGRFFCPNGHPRVFRESEADRLRKQLAAEKERADREAARASRNWQEKEAADRRASAARGLVTRMKKRTAHGVCPVDGCKRCFAKETALQRHLKTKHPDFEGSAPASGKAP